MDDYQTLVQLWLESDLVSDEDKKTIRQLDPNALAKHFSNQPLEFGTAGIRLLVGVGTQYWNVFTYRRVSTAYAKFLQLKKPDQQLSVVITHDNRTNGGLYALTCAEVFAAHGIKVYLAPERPLFATPLTSYLIRSLNANGGINITASHNPKNYNGFKAYNSSGVQVDDHDAALITTLMPSNDMLFQLDYAVNSELISYLPNYYPQFFNQIIQALPRTQPSVVKPLKVAFSPHHGVSSGEMVNFCHQLGYVNFLEYPLEANITGNYSDDEITNPEDPRSFEPLVAFANQINADYLMASDPDADRFALAERQADGSFYYFNGNENGILFTHYLLNVIKDKRNYYVVSSYVTNNFIDRLVAEYKIPVLRTGTGFKNISKIVEEQSQKGQKLLIAFEEAIGSLVFDFHREKDAFQSVALSLEMIDYYQQQNLKLTDVLNQLYQKYGYWYGITESFTVKADN